MKKFLVFVVICITTMSIGLTTYYFLRPTESVFAEQTFYRVNVGDVFAVRYTHENGRFGSKIYVTSMNPEIVEFNEVDGNFYAKAGGETVITITSNKNKFKGITINVVVGDGSEVNPYYIDSVDDFDKFGTEDFPLDKNYALATDIDFQNKAMKPIADGGSFTGKFNGQGFTLRNFSIETQNSNAGLFAKIGKSGYVHNLVVENASVEGNSPNAGVIAGTNNGRVEDVSVFTSTVDGETNAGGIVGLNASETKLSARIEKCVFTGDVYGDTNAGGIVGKMEGSVVVNCAVFPETTMNEISGRSGANIGGIAGSVNIGKNSDWLSVVMNSYNATEVRNAYKENRGGVVGFADDSQEIKQIIQGVYYVLDTATDNEQKGVGTDALDTETKIRFVKGVENKDGLKDLISYIKVDEPREVVEWDFNNIWENTSANDKHFNGYPKIRENALNTNIMNVIVDMGHSGNIENNEIDAPDKFKEFLNNNRAGVSYKLTKDIDFNNETISSFKDFEGKLYVEKGQNYAIKNLIINGNGFVKKITSTGVFENLTFINVRVENKNSDVAGVITGENDGQIIDCKVINSKVYTLIDESYAGGVCGVNFGEINGTSVSSTTITNEKGAVVKDSVSLGGIAGKNNKVINYAVVSGCNIGNDKLSENTEIENRYTIGGVAGINQGYIKGANISETKILAPTKTNQGGDSIFNQMQDQGRYFVKVGGIAGVNYNVDRRSAYAGGNKLVWLKNMVKNAEIENCLVDNSTIKGENAGGMASINYGDILSSQINNSEIVGDKVGGLATVNFVDVNNLGGNIVACLTTANKIFGDNDKSETAGIVLMTRAAKVKVQWGDSTYVVGNISTNSFFGQGTSYRETKALVSYDIDEASYRNNDGWYLMNFADNTVSQNAKGVKIEKFVVIYGTHNGYTNLQMQDNNFWQNEFINKSSGISDYFEFINGQCPTLKEIK